MTNLGAGNDEARQTIVFVDTNCVDNDNYVSRFFGRTASLDRLSRVCEIKVPQVVLDEITEHKLRRHEKERRQLLDNSIAKIVGINMGAVNDFDFDAHIGDLVANESLDYEVCEMEDSAEFMRKFYPLAIQHKPPFDAGSDKGFKDACIASTIDRYLSLHSEVDLVNLISSDSRLCDYYKDNDTVKTYQSIDCFLKALSADNRGASAPDKDSVSRRANFDSTHVVVDDAYPTSQTASRAAFDPERADAVEAYCSSKSFVSTHNAVKQLIPYSQDLSEQEIIRLVIASSKNDQVSWVLSDEDVHSFIVPLFMRVEDRLCDKDYRAFVNAAGLPDDRPDRYGNAVFSRVERVGYETFTDALISHVSSRGWNSDVKTNSDEVIKSLRGLLSLSTLDGDALSWKEIASSFFDGEVEVASGNIQPNLLEGFLEMLDGCSPLKRDAVIQAIAIRLDKVDVDANLPF